MLIHLSTFHITDWYATILGFAGADASSYAINGTDQWEGLKDSSQCTSEEKFNNFFFWRLMIINFCRD